MTVTLLLLASGCGAPALDLQQSCLEMSRALDAGLPEEEEAERLEDLDVHDSLQAIRDELVDALREVGDVEEDRGLAGQEAAVERFVAEQDRLADALDELGAACENSQ